MDVALIAPHTQPTFHLHPHEWFRGLHVRLPHLRHLPRKLLTNRSVLALRPIASIVLVFPRNLANILHLSLHLLQHDLTQVRLVSPMRVVAFLVLERQPTLQNTRLRKHLIQRFSQATLLVHQDA